MPSLTEGISCTHESVHIYIFLLHYKATKSVRRKVGLNTTAKVTAEMKQLVEEPMRRDDETSAYQLHQLLVSRGYNISVHSIYSAVEPLLVGRLEEVHIVI